MVTVHTTYYITVFVVDTDDMIQLSSTTTEEKGIKSKWELVDYGDDSDE